MQACDLVGFTGTQQWFRHQLNRKVTYTEGVQYFAEHAGNGAYWLLDILATQPEITKQGAEFAHIKLVVANNRAVLTVDDGNDNVCYTRDIDFTDCPAGEWRFYMADNVILLPSEY